MSTLRVFNRYVHVKLVWLAVAHFLILVGSVLAAVNLHYLAGPEPAIRSHPLMVVMAIVYALVALLCLLAMGLYRPQRERRYLAVFMRVVSALVFAALLAFTIFYLLPGAEPGRRVLPLALLLSLIGVGVAQAVFYAVIDRKLSPWRVLFYGAGVNAAKLLAIMEELDERPLFELVGCVAIDGEEPRVGKPLHRATGTALREFVHDHNVDEVVAVMDEWQHHVSSDDFMECRMSGANVVDALTFCERQTGQIQTELLRPEWLIFSPGFRKSRANITIKRALDLAGSVVLLSVLWPFMLAAMLAIKIEDGLKAPTIYRQIRCGLNGREFTICKFRSMRVDAEALSGPQWAEANDPRITRVGRVLRKLRVDELPQLWNVFAGDMSLVGPRPERPRFIKHLDTILPYYGMRETVKPGVTGWAQLRYSYGASDEDAAAKLRHDLYYIKNHSFFLDLLILAGTVEVVLFCKGSR